MDTSRVEEAITGVEIEHPFVAPCARCGKGGNWSEHRSCLHLPPFLSLQYARRYASKEGFKGYAVTLPRLVVFKRVYKLLATLNFESEHWTGHEPIDRWLPLKTVAMRWAAELWAEVRRQGMPTADRHALDIDVILAAQVLTSGLPLSDLVVATSNVAHLARFVPAQEWERI